MEIMKPAKKLGFGLMRLPELEDHSLDLAQTCRMVDAFLAQGFTYFDTAYVYHDGDAERIVRDAIVSRHPRESFTLATKLPSWEIKTPEDRDRVFAEQLDRTGAGYFDFYLLHAVGKSTLSLFDQFDCWNWALEKKAAGLIRHFGFSFHGTPEMLDELLTKHPGAEFVQLQINYLDWENPAVQSRRCYEVATAHGVPVIVMEPVKGGMLASMEDSAASLLKAADPNASLASWAVRYAASLPNVMVVLSGMSTPEQVADNLATMSDLVPLGESELALLDRVRKTLAASVTVACTACRYCVSGCPQDIPITDLIQTLNHVRLYGQSFRFRREYEAVIEGHNPPSACVSCGQCADICPQHLPVPELMKELADVFKQEE